MTRPLPNNNSPIIAGGIVGENLGKLKALRINGELRRVLGELRQDTTATDSCAGAYLRSYGLHDGTAKYCNPSTNNWEAVYGISSNESWGGAVGINKGSLSEIQYEGSLKIMDLDDSNGNVLPIIGQNIIDNTITNSGVISDIKYRGRFDSNKSPINSFMPANGTYSRLVLTPEDLQGLTASASFVPAGATHSICASNNGALVNCRDRTHISAEYTNMGLTFKDNSSAITGLDNMTDWNLSTGFLPDMTKTWKLHGAFSNDLPDLMKGDGDFPDIGKGF